MSINITNSKCSIGRQDTTQSVCAFFVVSNRPIIVHLIHQSKLRSCGVEGVIKVLSNINIRCKNAVLRSKQIALQQSIASYYLFVLLETAMR